MLLLRVLGLLVAVALGVCVLMYVLTSERRYLSYAWLIFKYALFLFVLVLLLIFGERLLAVVSGFGAATTPLVPVGPEIPAPGAHKVLIIQRFQRRRGRTFYAVA